MYNFQQPLLKKHAQETCLNIINAEKKVVLQNMFVATVIILLIV